MRSYRVDAAKAVGQLVESRCRSAHSRSLSFAFGVTRSLPSSPGKSGRIVRHASHRDRSPCLVAAGNDENLNFHCRISAFLP